VWVHNLVTNIKGRKYAACAYERGAGGDIRPTREEVTGDWRRFLVEELHDLCCLQDFRMITSRNTRYAKREIHTGDWENAYRVLVRKLR
jgi:hypothetical protein